MSVGSPSQPTPETVRGEILPPQSSDQPPKTKRPSKPLGGRPLKFKTPLELQTKIDAYFKDCDPHPEEYTDLEYPLHEKSGFPDHSQEPFEVKRMRWTEQKPYTVGGLAVFLGCSAETLTNYQMKKGFFGPIREALDKCRAYAENYLYTGKNINGAIFNLKANFKVFDDNPEKFKEKGTGVLELPGGLHFHNHIEAKRDEYNAH